MEFEWNLKMGRDFNGILLGFEGSLRRIQKAVGGDFLGNSKEIRRRLKEGNPMGI